MLGRLFKRRKDASAAARTLGQVGRDRRRQLVRDMTDRLRADLRAKGREDMTPIDWNRL